MNIKAEFSLPKSSVVDSSPTWTAHLASYIANLHYEDLPHDVVHRAKLTLVDTLGVTLTAGASEFGQKIAACGPALGSGGEATVFSRGCVADAAGSALATGPLSDVLEWPDCWRFGGLHPPLTVATARWE